MSRNMQSWNEWNCCWPAMSHTDTRIPSNVAYHKLIDKHKWLEEKVIKIWGFHKPITWWLHVIKAGWCSQLMLWGKEFIWRVMVGALPLGDALKKRNITKGSCFFCLVELEHSRHRFISSPMARMVWGCINLVWMSLTEAYLPSIGFLHIWRTMNQCCISKLSSSSWGIGGYSSIWICGMPSLLIRKLGWANIFSS